MELKKAVKARKSVRYFSPKKADWRKVIRAIDYARFAPAADNHFITKFIMVSDRENIENIASACQENFITEASFVVVVISNPSKLVKLYGERGERYAAQQSGAAIENFLLGLTEMKLTSGWVGYFHEETIKELLGIPEKMTVEAIFPVGRDSNARKALSGHHPELDETIYFDQWGNDEMKPSIRIKENSF